MEFVAREHEHVHGELGEVDGHLAHGLDRVGVEQHAPGLAQGGDLRDGEDGAGLVVGVHDGDKSRILADGPGQLVQVEAPPVVHAEIRHLVALFLQMLGQAQHGRMLDPGGDKMALFGLGGQGA
jgi:hypothetical protein